MNIIRDDHKGDTTVWQEKLYTQREVDDLLEKEQNAGTSGVLTMEEERRDVDRRNRANDRAVAKLVKKSNRILVSVSSVFPFDLFPDTINVEEGRVTIIRRRFFSSSRIHSVDIKDISNVFVNVAPFFAQLVIISRTFEENEVRIKFIRKKEAVYIRRIIEGLRSFVGKQIETSNYSKQDLIAKLEELSTTSIVT